jgi:hypothetical protein
VCLFRIKTKGIFNLEKPVSQCLISFMIFIHAL